MSELLHTGITRTVASAVKTAAALPQAVASVPKAVAGLLKDVVSAGHHLEQAMAAEGKKLAQFARQHKPNLNGASSAASSEANGSSNRDTIVLITGPGRGNPLGHTAIGIEGRGLFNQGTAESGFAFGKMSIEDYIAQERPHREVEVFRIPTTPEQEQAIEQQLRSCDPKVDTLGEQFAYASGDVCTRSTARPLEQLGLIDKSLLLESISQQHGLAGAPAGAEAGVKFAEALPSTLRGRLQARGYQSELRPYIPPDYGMAPDLQAGADNFMRGGW